MKSQRKSLYIWLYVHTQVYQRGNDNWWVCLHFFSCLLVLSCLLKIQVRDCRCWGAHTPPSALPLERGLAKDRMSLVPVEILCGWPHRRVYHAGNPVLGDLGPVAPAFVPSALILTVIGISACRLLKDPHRTPLTCSPSSMGVVINSYCFGSAALSSDPDQKQVILNRGWRTGFTRVPMPKLEKQVQLPLYFTHVGFHPILEKRSNALPL